MSEHYDQPATGVWQHVGAVVSGLKQRIGRAVDNARARSELRSEFAHLDQAGELDLVLSDIGLSRSELPTLVHNHPGAARRLAAMLKRLRIKLAPEVENDAEMRAIQRTCLLCAASGHCDRWLATESSDNPHRFCPNGDAFDDLVTSGKASYDPTP